MFLLFEGLKCNCLLVLTNNGPGLHTMLCQLLFQIFICEICHLHFCRARLVRLFGGFLQKNQSSTQNPITHPLRHRRSQHPIKNKQKLHWVIALKETYSSRAALVGHHGGGQLLVAGEGVHWRARLVVQHG